jgi:adenine deaminase
MADVTYPLPAEGAGIGRADGYSATLAAAARQARKAGGGLVLAAQGAPVLRVLDLTGLMTGVAVYSSVEDRPG